MVTEYSDHMREGDIVALIPGTTFSDTEAADCAPAEFKRDKQVAYDLVLQQHDKLYELLGELCTKFQAIASFAAMPDEVRRWWVANQVEYRQRANTRERAVRDAKAAIRASAIAKLTHEERVELGVQ